MEKDTNSVLVKSGMQSWGTKLFHSYHCQFDQTVATSMHEGKENKKNICCPAFMEVGQVTLPDFLFIRSFVR